MIFVDIYYNIGTASVEISQVRKLTKTILLCSGNERGRFSHPLIPHLIEICFYDIFQQFFPVDARYDVPCSIVVGDISGIFRQYVTDDLHNRIIAFFP